MTAILYPVAPNAEAALAAPLGRAARARQAAEIAEEPAVFVTEATGPAFASREAALDAYAGRLEDDRAGRAPPAIEDRYCQLTEQLLADAPKSAPQKPSFAEGRRWPPPPERGPRTAWRLLVSYWRPASAGPQVEAPQARRARRRAAAAELAPDTLRAMAQTPLRPIEPQRPLDIGLFERRLPESPHIVVPDE